MGMHEGQVAFTIIDGDRITEVDARLTDGRVHLAPPAAAKAGLGDQVQSAVDLVELARRLDRPLALDIAERAAFLGVSAAARAARLAALEAPDFMLPDLDGRLHSLSDHRGKKVFLLAYASW